MEWPARPPLVGGGGVSETWEVKPAQEDVALFVFGFSPF